MTFWFLHKALEDSQLDCSDVEPETRSTQCMSKHHAVIMLQSFSELNF